MNQVVVTRRAESPKRERPESSQSMNPLPEYTPHPSALTPGLTASLGKAETRKESAKGLKKRREG